MKDRGREMKDNARHHNESRRGSAGRKPHRMPWRGIVLACALAVFPVAGGAAHAVETLKWEDLAPPEPTTQNPISQLTSDQKTNLYRLYVGQHFAGETATRNVEEQRAWDELKASGADPDALLAKVVEIRKDQEKRDNTLLFALDKKVIKLPGYVLPVDFEGTLVKTFLLVPFVGACIHVPPPPLNQIVFVQADKPFESEELYAPVWVTGPIRVGKGNRQLELVDGSNAVAFGYSLKATRVEPYER
jgi:hypothetical protein